MILRSLIQYLITVFDYSQVGLEVQLNKKKKNDDKEKNYNLKKIEIIFYYLPILEVNNTIFSSSSIICLSLSSDKF
jgi:hypothetical protein